MAAVTLVAACAGWWNSVCDGRAGSDETSGTKMLRGAASVTAIEALSRGVSESVSLHELGHSVPSSVLVGTGNKVVTDGADVGALEAVEETEER